jgi:adenine phosphoribosyltransferase
VVRRYIELLGERDLDALDEFIAEDVIVVAPDSSVVFRDRQTWKQAQQDSPFSDERITPEQIVSDGEQVAVSYTVTAVHTGEAFGIAPTGGPITTSGTKIYTVGNGKIRQIAGHDDVLGLMRRIGGTMSSGEAWRERGDLRADIVGRFSWADGHADVWKWFHDGQLLARVASGLADPFRDVGITRVAGIESRGFLLGGLVAGQLEAGFLPIRKDRGLFPGLKITKPTLPDYRGNTSALRVQLGSAGPGDHVLLVDDWIETGHQAVAARDLVEATGARFSGISVIVDQLAADARPHLIRVHALVSSEDLPACPE